MKATTRIERIKNAHPFLSEHDVRKLLIFGYKAACVDITERMEDGEEFDDMPAAIQSLLEEDIEEFCTMDEEDVKDQVAFVQEFLVTT